MHIKYEDSACAYNDGLTHRKPVHVRSAQLPEMQLHLHL